MDFLSRNKKYLLKSRDHHLPTKNLRIYCTDFAIMQTIMQSRRAFHLSKKLLMDFDCTLCPSLWFLRAVDELVGIDEGSDACDDIMTYGFAT